MASSTAQNENENEKRLETANLVSKYRQKLSLDLERIKCSMESDSMMGKVYVHSYREKRLASYVEDLANAVDNGEYRLAQRLVGELKSEGVLKTLEA